IHLVYDSIYGTPESVIAHSRELLKICRTNTKRKFIYGYEYILTLQQLTSSLRILGKEKEAAGLVDEVLQDADAILRDYPQRIKNFLITRTLIIEINRNMVKGDFNKNSGMLND